jgi:hypothetical protein
MVPDEALNNGWTEYKRLVMSSLDDLHTKNTELDAKLDKLIVEVALLKAKAAMIGAVVGIVVSGIASLVINFLS